MTTFESLAAADVVGVLDSVTHWDVKDRNAWSYTLSVVSKNIIDANFYLATSTVVVTR